MGITVTTVRGIVSSDIKVMPIKEVKTEEEVKEVEALVEEKPTKKTVK